MENSRIYENKLNQITNNLQDEIKQQKKLNKELEKEMKRKNYENEEKMRKMKEINDDQIQKIKQKNEEQNKINKEKIQNLDKTLKEFDEKEKTYIQNKISAENEYNKTCPEVFESYYKDETDLLIQEILKEMDIFLTNDLSFDDLNTEIIPKIVKKEKYATNIRDFMEDRINSIKDENLDFKVSHFNILIMGNTGVGKSTLLNKVLKADLAKTDFGKACTQGKPFPYTSNNAKGIRIWDTKGIEPGNYNINAANIDIEETIDKLIKENDPDKFIHCIWYCVHSNRLVEDEFDNLKNYQ